MPTGFSALLIAFVAFASISVSGQRSSGSFVKGEILVKFRAGADNASVRNTNHALGGERLERLGDLGWTRVKLGRGVSVEKALARYKEFANVEMVQPN